MKQAVILKAAGGAPATAEQLTRINAFTRRELTADEVYVFSLVLCDNEVDRDFERFPAESLETLAGLFLGKTGIFDHNPKGENQTSRIFETAVERGGEPTRAGEDYCALRAWAYMVRCEKNADLILEIDAGIKKEVSVGCAVGQVVCSVCGADMRAKPCGHETGKTYKGALCWHELIAPTDAYEWSFVAVPAQRLAGVTKGRAARKTPDDDTVRKALAADAPVTLSGAQAAALLDELNGLEKLADCGRARMEELRRRMVAAAAFTLPALDARTVREVADTLDERQLEAFCKGLTKSAPPFLQLGGARGDRAKADNGPFLI